MNLSTDRIYNGMKSPALLVLLCPAVAACTDAMSGLWMGISGVLVYAAAELVCRALRTILTGKARLPVLLVTAGTAAAVLSLLFAAYLPDIYSVIGPYLPLTAVFCLMLDLAETGGMGMPSLSGKIGLALGFTASLILFGLLREFLGAGTLLGVQVLPADMAAMGMFVRAPGAFLILAVLLMSANALGWTGKSSASDASASAQRKEEAK